MAYSSRTCVWMCLRKPGALLIYLVEALGKSAKKKGKRELEQQTVLTFRTPRSSISLRTTESLNQWRRRQKCFRKTRLN